MRGQGNRGYLLGVAGLSTWMLLSLCGCSGAGRVEVLRPSESKGRYSSAMVMEEGTLGSVPDGVRREFRSTLARYLYERGPFRQGPELRILYAITGYHPPEERIGPDGEKIAVAGYLTADVWFFNFVEKKIGSIRSHWESGKSGSMDKAVAKCARQVASYAKRTFWYVGGGPEEDRLTKEEQQDGRWKAVNGMAR